MGETLCAGRRIIRIGDTQATQRLREAQVSVHGGCCAHDAVTDVAPAAAVAWGPREQHRLVVDDWTTGGRRLLGTVGGGW